MFFPIRKPIPVLMYHRIADIPGDRNALPPQKLEKQLSYLATQGYQTITLQELFRYYQQDQPLPAKAVLLTFDDGYADNFSIALPLLKARKMTAVVFPIINWIGKENRWENFQKKITTTMNLEQLHQWQAAGMEIGSHTMNHPFLSTCTLEDLKTELINSKQFLEKEFSSAIDFLCYPYGDFNPTVMDIAKQAGYKGAFAIFANAPIWSVDPFALARIPIPARQPLWEFALKVSPIHPIFNTMRKVERKIKKWRKK